MKPDVSNRMLFNLSNYLSFSVPRGLWRMIKPDFERRLHKIEMTSSAEYEYIMSRASFYNRLENAFQPDSSFTKLSDMHLGKYKSAYLLDLWHTSRWFSGELRVRPEFGDVYWRTEKPSISKSRPISEDNLNNVLLKLDRCRHFKFISDQLDFNMKMSSSVFRGDIGDPEKQNRVEFMKLYFGTEICNCGSIRNMPGLPEKWLTEKMPISEQLKYRYIISLEGNDVATNLKWIMSSNSLAVTPRLTCETWYMESRLVPGEHFVLIRDDFTDLPEQIEYYSSHPKESMEIISNAHEYISQFLDKEREDLIEYLVLEKYFRLSGQI